MPAVHRKGDTGSGHGAFPSRANNQGSPNVYVNGIAVHRKGDSWLQHCSPVMSCHTSVLSSGSTTVFVNGLDIARIGDPVACGSTCATGSSNVFAGG